MICLPTFLLTEKQRPGAVKKLLRVTQFVVQQSQNFNLGSLIPSLYP